MKTLSKTLLALMVMSISIIGYSQTAILGYMKIKPGNTAEYLEIEKEFKKIHQANVDLGNITSWQLYQKMFAATGDPYQYITVSIYDDFNKTENQLPWEWLEENYSDEEWINLLEKTRKSRTQVRVEVYNYTTGAENSIGAKYIFINKMKTKPGKSGEYADFEKEIVKPVFEEAIRMGSRNSWHVWRKWLADDEFQFVTVDGYSEYGQWDGNWEGTTEAFEKAHPGKDMDELMGDNVGELRTRKSVELWKLIDIVSAPAE